MTPIERKARELLDKVRALKEAPTAAPAGEAVAWMHGVCADDGEEDQALSFSPDNFPLEGVAGYRKVWCRPLIYGDTHPPAAEVREVNADRSLAAAFREVSACSYAQDGVAGELFAEVRKRAAALSPPGRAEGEGS